MSVKLTGDIYLTNVSSGLGGPVETELHQQIEELKNEIEQLKQSLHETRRRECELAIEVALNQVKSELLKNEMDILKKEREEAAKLAKKLDELFNKKEQK
ncbi:unnamed protein product [Brachionus calyciflorus]|uniref:Uncharacterized protein n=1 Tax=Brachionus calyciflorus TaxID=104777 RepID=A0A814N9Y9_9BILA|nr:unnamed protein product [Brachionus calyciflorus]